MKKNTFVTFVLALSLLLTGCWDQKNLHDIYYVTAVGIDYDNGLYICYGQLLDFASAAKLEPGRSEKDLPIYNGIGEGKTLKLAMSALSRSSQLMVSWTQVSSIVLSKRMLEHGIDHITDRIARFHEIRYTPWMFGTEEDLRTLFIQKPLFSLSAIATILHEPMDNYKQQSLIPPIRLNDMLRHYQEPGFGVLLPKLGIKRSTWRSDDKKVSLLYVNGAYLIQNRNYLGELSSEELIGYRWVTKRTVASSLYLEHKGENGSTSITIRKVHPKVSWSHDPHTPKFEINIRAKGKIEELSEGKVSVNKIGSASNEKIAKEVRYTFEKALAKGFDIYGLQELVRRKDPAFWQDHFVKQQETIDASSIANIRVQVTLDSSGQLEYRSAS